MGERIFTLEADGQPILCFPARSYKEAQSLLKEQWLLSDLRTVRSQDRPVWDGRAKLKVSNALPSAFRAKQRRLMMSCQSSI
jgi:hypothetical protein